MIRALFWFAVYLLTLGLFNIEAEYKDGLSIKLRSWRHYHR